ncbi:MAG: enoyl-CoA hydratase [Synergistaceae bacterium]|nr:enoyl-CoA hydratase [Synergistaceae bacterium]
MSSYKKLELIKKSGVAVITMKSPESMNALEIILFEELCDATSDVEGDDSVKAVILTGTGRAFCAGGDLKRFSEGFKPNEGYLYMKKFAPWVRQFAGMCKPTIAAVNGYAVGAGFCMALHADIILASEDAKFGMAFVNVGLIPDLGGLYVLPRLVGFQKAKELVFTGRNISAAEAMEIGIVNRVTPADKLLEESFGLAKKIAEGPSFAHRMAKSLINASPAMTLDQLLEQEALFQAQCIQTEDHKNAAEAFLRKEKPVFKGK